MEALKPQYELQHLTSFKVIQNIFFLLPKIHCQAINNLTLEALSCKQARKGPLGRCNCLVKQLKSLLDRVQLDHYVSDLSEEVW